MYISCHYFKQNILFIQKYQDVSILLIILRVMSLTRNKVEEFPNVEL